MVSSSSAEAGFLTPVFGVVVIALGLIALACLQLARAEHVAARRNTEHVQKAYAADGVAVTAAWRVMHDPGVDALRWRELVDDVSFTVLAEPEMRKLSLAEVGGQRGRRRLRGLVDEQHSEPVATALAALAGRASAPPSRASLLAAHAMPAWRDCGLTLVSSFSRLTDYALAPPRSPQNGDLSLRAGEVWRFVVADESRVVLDRLVRFTGEAQSPVVTVDELQSAGRRTVLGCGERMAAD